MSPAGQMIRGESTLHGRLPNKGSEAFERIAQGAAWAMRTRLWGSIRIAMRCDVAAATLILRRSGEREEMLVQLSRILSQVLPADELPTRIVGEHLAEISRSLEDQAKRDELGDERRQVARGYDGPDP